jgi:hypothetical protein
MALSRDDKTFLIGLAAALAAVVLYRAAVRPALCRGDAAPETERLELQSQLGRLSDPAGEPADAAERALVAHESALASREAELHRALEFSPASVLDPFDPLADPHLSPAAYAQLSRSLHARLATLRERKLNPTRLPAVFDPQGEVRPPADPARVPRLHRQLLIAYSVLARALDCRVDVLDLQTDPARSRAASPGVLDETRLTLKTQSTLDELAAFLHALSVSSHGGQPSAFLAVERLAIARSPDRPQLLHATLTLAALRTAEKGEGTADERR